MELFKHIMICRKAVHSKGNVPGWFASGNLEDFRCYLDKRKKCKNCKDCLAFDVKETASQIIFEEHKGGKNGTSI